MWIKKSKHSYVISVSLGTGCYRHIQISEGAALEELSDYILDCFAFENDHAHAFFMDNQAWSDTDAYYAAFIEDEERYTDEYTLGQIGLVKDQKFKYVFDFGEEWLFQCRVLQVLDEDTPKPLLLRSKGEPPEQYPVYDEEQGAPFFINSRESSAKEAETIQENPEIPDELFKLAFQYRDTRLWKKLYDTEIFAVRFSTGETGCCCVMGYRGDYISLAVYIGEKAARSYLRLTQLAQPTDEAEVFEAMHQQDCLQCGYYNKSDLAEEIVAPVQSYAKSHGINLKGKFTYPNFIACKPFCMPWFITDSNDFIYLQEALSAALEVADKLKTNTKKQLGFNSDLALVPLLCPGENGYTWETYQMPEITEEYPSPELENDLIQQISELPKKGTWECEVVILPAPIAASGIGAPYYPTLLIAVDTEHQHIIPTYPVENYFQESQQMLLELADAMLTAGVAPELITLPDKRTEAFLSRFCKACGISCTLTADSFTMLDDVREEMLTHLGGGSDEAMMGTMAELLMSLDDDALLAMPPELLRTMTELLGQNVLPPELEKRLRRLFDL